MTRSSLLALPLSALILSLGACSQGGDGAAQAADKPTAASASPVAPPSVRAGRWLMRKVSFQGSQADRDLLDAEPEFICIKPGASILDTGGAEVAKCGAPSIRRNGATYVVEGQCVSEGLRSATRATYSGDFQTTLKIDMALSLAPAGQPLETVRIGLDGRFQGPCTGDED